LLVDILLAQIVCDTLRGLCIGNPYREVNLPKSDSVNEMRFITL
jgi:hypothetical protein